MFHVELRQFPHQARAFNLGRAELEARILVPWVSRTPLELDDRRWAPGRARLTIYEGPELAADQLGLGRGWANVTRTGEDVTARVIAEASEAAAHPPPVMDFRREVVELCAAGPVALGGLVELAGRRFPQSRVSERVTLCERTVWELLHEGVLALVRSGAPVAREEWPEMLLNWEAWRTDAVLLERR